MGRGGSLLWINSALCLIFVFLFIDWLVDYGSFSLIHSPHRFACEVGSGLIVIERVDSCDFVWARANINVSFWLVNFLGFRLRPGNASGFNQALIGVILSWSNFILFFSFEVLDRWLIEFKLIVFILVIAIGVDVRGDGGDGLILIDVDQMF